MADDKKPATESKPEPKPVPRPVPPKANPSTVIKGGGYPPKKEADKPNK